MDWQLLRPRLLKCWHLFQVLALVALVGLATFVAVARQVLPFADRWRPSIEQMLSERMGLPVTLTSLTAQLNGLSFELHLNGLMLHDPVLGSSGKSGPPESSLLYIPDIEVRPVVWQSLWHLEPRFATILHGLNIHLEQLPDGKLQIRELARLKESDADTARQTLEFVLRQPALGVRDSRVVVALQNYPVLRLSRLELTNLNEGDRHRLAGQVHVEGSAEPLQLNLSLTGDPLNWQSSQIDFWTKLPTRVLDGWLPSVDVAGLQLRHLTGGGEYWFHFQQGQLQRMEAKPNWSELVLQGRQGPLRITNLQGELSLSREGQQWQLAGQQLRGRLENQPWPLPVLALQVGENTVSVAAQYTKLEGMTALVGKLPLSAEIADWIAAAKPGGTVASLRVDLRRPPEQDWQLERLLVDAQGLRFSPTATMPGAEGVSGWLSWTPQQAWLGVTLRTARLDLLQVFREPVNVQQLQGHLRVRQSAQGMQLDSDVINARNSDATGQAIISAFIPEQDPDAATLSLRARLKQGRVASAWRYVPWKPAGDNALHWLQTALQGGVVTQGDFLFEGPIHHRDDLPASDLQMRFLVQDGRLDYGTGWPVLRDLNASVYIEGTRLLVSAQQTRLLEASQGHALRAEIADFHHPVLTVEGDVASNGTDLMRFFRESPLKTHVGRVPEELGLDGVVNGHLKLTVPLHDDEGEPDVDVQAELPANRLQILKAKLVAEALTGNVSFSTKNGLQADSLSAVLFNEPVKAKIASRVSKGDLAEVNVDVDGKVSASALRAWLGGGVFQYASGTAPYQAQVTIPTNHEPARLQVNSSLAGMRVTLPTPFAKGTEPRSVNYQSSLGGEEQKASLRYGNILTAGLVWRDDRLERVLFRVAGNGEPLPLAWPSQTGTEIEGSVKQLDIQAWLPRVQRAQSAGNEQGVVLPELTRLQLSANELKSDLVVLNHARMDLQPVENGWQLGISSDELAGDVRFSERANSDIQIALNRLTWPLPLVDKKQGGTGKNNARMDTGAHPVRLNVESLRLASWPKLGAFNLTANVLPSPLGWHVEQIALKGPVLNFNGQMDWQWRGGNRTTLTGSVESNNVADLLQSFDYAPSLVSSLAKGTFDLSWKGEPEDMEVSSLEGSVKLSIQQGRLLNVSNTTSASRVFGWFDLDNIKRRFKGDFSDMTKRGLSFDKAEIEGRVQAGVMDDVRLLVEGPTLKAQGNGKINLVQQTLDQDLLVVVPVTSAIPVAAIAVGGPLIGGAVAVAHMALEKQIDKAMQIRYRVSGSWSDPKVERNSVKVPDASSEVVRKESNAVIPARNNMQPVKR